MQSLSRVGVAFEYIGFATLASHCRITNFVKMIFQKNQNPSTPPPVIFRDWSKQKEKVRKDFEKVVNDTTDQRLKKEEKTAQKKD